MESAITASVLDGATANHVKTMLRTLLAKRFDLAFHREWVLRPPN